jgi:hypothetical protein
MTEKTIVAANDIDTFNLKKAVQESIKNHP